MVTVKVPASTANLGPGFDCLGLALNLFNTFEIEEIDYGLEIEGCPDEFKNEDNLVFVSLKKCFEKIGYKYKGIRINMKCNIPLSSGLGSSSACILGGIIGANEIAGNILSESEILDLATSIEGHPDNLAAAFFGGLTISLSKNKVYYEKFTVPKGLKFYTLIPDFSLSTKKSRSVLPSKVDFKDAVSNIGSCALLVSALIKGNFDLLNICNDKLHEPYRTSLIPNFINIKNVALANDSCGVFLSGAGPTILVLVKESNNSFLNTMISYLNTLEDKWCIKELSICNEGVTVNQNITI